MLRNKILLTITHLQWEALGDFSENHIAALKAYDKGAGAAIGRALKQGA